MAQPSDVLHVFEVEYQRAPAAFPDELTRAWSYLQEAAVDQSVDGGAILVTRHEHADSVVDHLQHSGVALNDGQSRPRA